MEPQACQEPYRWYRIIEAGPWVILRRWFIHSVQVRVSRGGFEIGRNHYIRRWPWPWAATAARTGEE
jgi:hypothetical protein